MMRWSIRRQNRVCDPKEVSYLLEEDSVDSPLARKRLASPTQSRRVRAPESARLLTKGSPVSWIWIVIIIIVVLAILGYFGRGRFSR
jgi:hypothetical protein